MAKNESPQIHAHHSRLVEPLSVSAAWTRSLVEFALQQGVEKSLLEAALQAPLDRLQSDIWRLPMDHVVKLWEVAALHSHNPYFGLHFGCNVRPGTFHVLGYVLMSSATLDEALQRLARYQRLISDGGSLSSSPASSGLWLFYQPKPATRPFIYHQVDAVLASMVTFMQWMIGRPLHPEAVHFRHQYTGPLDPYTQALGCAPLFGQAQDGILIADAVLSLPLVEADPELARLHDLRAEKLLTQIQGRVNHASLRQRIEALISDEVLHASAAQKLCAQRLHMSERTLHRKLAQEHTSFREIVGQIRRQRAMAYLMDSSIPIAEVSALLGFNDVSAFYRAVRRWSGKTPLQWRDESLRP